MKRIITFIALSLALIFPGTVGASAPPLSLTEEEIELTARAVRAKTGGENFLIKTCVTAMIFNRLKDPSMPDSIKGVVFDGAFLTASGEDAGEEIPCEELEEYVVLAKLVSFYGIDPACGATFCFTGGEPVPENFVVTLSSGNFVFAKPGVT